MRDFQQQVTELTARLSSTGYLLSAVLQFGQQDDITVLTLTSTSAEALHA